MSTVRAVLVIVFSDVDVENVFRSPLGEPAISLVRQGEERHALVATQAVRSDCPSFSLHKLSAIRSVGRPGAPRVTDHIARWATDCGLAYYKGTGTTLALVDPR